MMTYRLHVLFGEDREVCPVAKTRKRFDAQGRYVATDWLIVSKVAGRVWVPCTHPSVEPYRYMETSR